MFNDPWEIKRPVTSIMESKRVLFVAQLGMSSGNAYEKTAGVSNPLTFLWRRGDPIPSGRPTFATLCSCSCSVGGMYCLKFKPPTLITAICSCPLLVGWLPGQIIANLGTESLPK